MVVGGELKGKPRDKNQSFLEREFVLLHRNLNLVLWEKDIPKVSFKHLLEGPFVQRTERCQKRRASNKAPVIKIIA